MRVMQCLLTTAAAASLLACEQSTDIPSSPSPAQFVAGFVTNQPAQARAILPPAQVKPIITVGDPIPGATDADAEQRVWAPIPDGLGAYPTADGLVLFANHEITSGGVGGHFKNARVSRLVLDPATLSVKSGSYAITGQRTSGAPVGPLVQRLRSATFNGSARRIRHRLVLHRGGVVYQYDRRDAAGHQERWESSQGVGFKKPTRSRPAGSVPMLP